MDIFHALTMLGGLCLFLFGMNFMGQALERRAGGKLRTLLDKMTGSVGAGFLTGLGITAIIQSSSATTVMVVGFVNSGLMTLRQAINVIMGANVGTTVTAVFGLSHIDRLPLGDLPQTMATLIGGSPEKDFRLEFDYDGARFAADTREYRAVLGEEISLAEPEVLAFITGQVAEGIAECCPAPEKL